MSGDVSTGDHHSAYLTRAVAALTPEGRARAGVLLDQLVRAAGGNEELTRFANARRAEILVGEVGADPEPGDALTPHELNELATGFVTIRDQEHLDDVADWANAVVALLEDELGT